MDSLAAPAEPLASSSQASEASTTPLPDTHAPAAVDIPSPEQLGRHPKRVWIAMVSAVALGLAALAVAASFSGGQVEQAAARPPGPAVAAVAVAASPAAPERAQPPSEQYKPLSTAEVESEASNTEPKADDVEPKANAADESAEDEPPSLQDRLKAALKAKKEQEKELTAAAEAKTTEAKTAPADEDSQGR